MISHRQSSHVLCMALSYFLVGNTLSAGQSTYFGADNPRGALANSNAAASSFLATLSSFGTDNLDSFTGFTVNPTLTFGATGITAQPDFRYVVAFASLAVSGSNALLDAGPSAADGPAINDSLTFSKPITAFGSYFSNAGDATTANSVSLKLEHTLLGTSKTISIGTFGPSLSFSNVFYFGITDTDPFNKVTLVETFDYDGILLDNITAGYVAIPEASSLLFTGLAVGLASVVFARQKRRQS
jgi:hypothetical protein